MHRKLRLATLVLASVTACGGSPVDEQAATSSAVKVEPSNGTRFLLEVSGITADSTTIIGGFKSMSGMDSEVILTGGEITSGDLRQWRRQVVRAPSTLLLDRPIAIFVLDQDGETEVASRDYSACHPVEYSEGSRGVTVRFRCRTE